MIPARFGPSFLFACGSSSRWSSRRCWDLRALQLRLWWWLWCSYRHLLAFCCRFRRWGRSRLSRWCRLRQFCKLSSLQWGWSRTRIGWWLGWIHLNTRKLASFRPVTSGWSHRKWRRCRHHRIWCIQVGKPYNCLRLRKILASRNIFLRLGLDLCASQHRKSCKFAHLCKLNNVQDKQHTSYRLLQTLSCIDRSYHSTPNYRHLSICCIPQQCKKYSHCTYQHTVYMCFPQRNKNPRICYMFQRWRRSCSWWGKACR